MASQSCPRSDRQVRPADRSTSGNNCEEGDRRRPRRLRQSDLSVGMDAGGRRPADSHVSESFRTDAPSGKRPQRYSLFPLRHHLNHLNCAPPQSSSSSSPAPSPRLPTPLHNLLTSDHVIVDFFALGTETVAKAKIGPLGGAKCPHRRFLPQRCAR